MHTFKSMAYNGPAFPTSTGLKAMVEPYIALMLGSDEPAAAAVRLVDVARLSDSNSQVHPLYFATGAGMQCYMKYR